MDATMEAFYVIFKNYEYNDENLNLREQKIVNAGKNIIRDFEVKTDTYESKIDYLKSQVESLQAHIEVLKGPEINPMGFSDKDFSPREKYLMNESLQWKSQAESLDNELYRSESEVENLKSQLGLLEEDVAHWRNQVVSLRKDNDQMNIRLTEIQNALEKSLTKNMKLKKKIVELEDEARNQFDYVNQENKFTYHGNVVYKMITRTNQIVDQLNKDLEYSNLGYTVLQDQFQIVLNDNQRQQLKIENLQNQNDWNKSFIKVLLGITFVLILSLIFF